jgi:hypothetical protein
MGAPLSAEEAVLRARLTGGENRIRQVPRTCPALDRLDLDGFEAVDALVAEAAVAIADALACTDSLEALSAVSEEAVLMAWNSRMALAIVREVLGRLTAEIQERSEAI